MKEINLVYSDEDWDYTFVELCKKVACIAEGEGGISEKQYYYIMSTLQQLVSFYNRNKNKMS